MKVLVCGGRNFKNRSGLMDFLAKLHAEKIFTEVIHGGALGADTFAGEFARKLSIQENVFYPDWDRFGMSAGVLRNLQMLEEAQPDLVVVCPGGRGTAHMHEQALKYQVPVVVYNGQ